MLGWALKQLFIWTGVGLLGFVLLSFRPEALQKAIDSDGTDERAETAAASSENWTSNGRELTIRASDDGHFRVVAEVDGQDVDFLVDTGATGIVVATDVAERLGLRLDDSDYTLASDTAGGIVRAAPITLDEIEIGPLRVRNLDALVLEKLEGVSLLGMAFLNRLDGFDVRGDELTLYW